MPCYLRDEPMATSLTLDQMGTVAPPAEETAESDNE